MLSTFSSETRKRNKYWQKEFQLNKTKGQQKRKKNKQKNNSQIYT